MEDYGMAGAVIMGSVLLFLVLFVICVTIYILAASWEMKFLKSIGYPNSWFAWIPVLNFYAIADVAFGNAPKAKLAVINKPVPTAVFKFASLISIGASLVLGRIPIVNGLVGILSIIFNIAVILPILDVLSRRYNAPISNVRKYVDIFIQIILFYDLKSWSEKYQYNPYVDISDIAGNFDDMSYQQPMNGYQAPMQGYQQPMQGYQQPMQGYQQPMQGYQQPMNGYQQPMNGYQQPMNGYQQPMQQPQMQQPMQGFQQANMQIGGYTTPQGTMQDARFAPPSSVQQVVEPSYEETFTPPTSEMSQDFSNSSDSDQDLF